MKEPSLFDGAAKARRTDPSTSHEAAREVELSGAAGTQRGQVLAALMRMDTPTSGEIAATSGIDRHTVSKRLPELEEKCLARRLGTRICRARGTRMLTWEAVPEP